MPIRKINNRMDGHRWVFPIRKCEFLFKVKEIKELREDVRYVHRTRDSED
jgi:hypothetical protein